MPLPALARPQLVVWSPTNRCRTSRRVEDARNRDLQNAALAADANNMAAMPLQLSMIAVATAATLANVPSVDSRAADQSHEAPWLESASSALVASNCCRAADPPD